MSDGWRDDWLEVDCVGEDWDVEVNAVYVGSDWQTSLFKQQSRLISLLFLDVASDEFVLLTWMFVISYNKIKFKSF